MILKLSLIGWNHIILIKNLPLLYFYCVSVLWRSRISTILFYLPINLDPKLLRLKKLVDKNDSQSIILIVSNNISSEEALNEFQENIYTLSTHYIRSLGSVKGFSDNRKLIGSSKCMIEEIQYSINNIWKYRLRDKPVDKE